MMLECSADGCSNLVTHETAVRCGVCRGTSRRDELQDGGTSPVVGVLLMFPVVITLAVSVMLWAGAFEESVDAHRRAAEVASWCARNPDREHPGEMECPSYGPRGWSCDPADLYPEVVLKCVPVDSDESTGNYMVVKAGTNGTAEAVDSR